MRNKTAIWKYIKEYRLNSIFVKNFVLILLIVMLPLSIITMFIYSYFNRVMEDELKNVNKASLVKVRDTTDMIIRECNNIGLRVISDTNTLLYMLSSESISDEVILPNPVDYLKYMIQSFTLTNDYIDSIYIFSRKKNYVISNRSSADLDYFFDRSWYETYMNKGKEKIFWMDARKTQTSSVSNTHSYLSLFRVYDENAGVVIINIDLAKLGTIINDNGNSNKNMEDIFILDKDNRVIYNKLENRIGSFYSDDLNVLSGNRDGSFLVRDDGAKRIISVVPSSFSDWRYVSDVSLTNFEERVKELNRFITLFILICILIALIVSFLISIRVFGPIRDIMSAFERPEAWLQEKTDGIPKRYDEIRFISSNIADSYNSVHELKSNLEKRVTLLKKAQTVALQSQINPHFLYNTLETINWMAMEMTKGKNKVSGMILSLSQLLRLSLDTGSNLIPVSSEIEHAKLYLEIQKYRYGEKFDARWEIDEGIIQYNIVKITIQPLVENAIYHGIKPKEGKGAITVKGYFCNEDIAIEVCDDGMGIDSSMVDTLNRELQNEFLIFDRHIGLKNVNQRIKLIMGDQYGLSVRSDANGTLIRMLIPKTLPI